MERRSPYTFGEQISSKRGAVQQGRLRSGRGHNSVDGSKGRRSTGRPACAAVYAIHTDGQPVKSCGTVQIEVTSLRARTVLRVTRTTYSPLGSGVGLTGLVSVSLNRSFARIKISSGSVFFHCSNLSLTS